MAHGTSWDQPLDANGVSQLVRLTRQGLSQRRIGMLLKRNHHVISSTQRQLRLNKNLGKGVRRRDPTVDEIYAHAERIRATWSKGRLEKSTVGTGHHWQPIAVPESVLRLAKS